MVGTQVLKHLPGARKGKRRGSKGDVRVIEDEEVRGDDPVEYVLPVGSEVPLESQRG